MEYIQRDNYLSVLDKSKNGQNKYLGDIKLEGKKFIFIPKRLIKLNAKELRLIARKLADMNEED